MISEAITPEDMHTLYLFVSIESTAFSSHMGLSSISIIENSWNMHHIHTYMMREECYSILGIQILLSIYLFPFFSLPSLFGLQSESLGNKEINQPMIEFSVIIQLCLNHCMHHSSADIDLRKRWLSHAITLIPVISVRKLGPIIPLIYFQSIWQRRSSPESRALRHVITYRLHTLDS